MKVLVLVLCCANLVCGMSFGGSRGMAAEKPGTEEVREAIAKSLPFIVEKGQWWIDEKKCVSCHRVSFMTWSLSAAKQHGFEVDAKLNEWQDWFLKQLVSEREKGGLVGEGNLEGLAQFLLSREQTGESAECATAYSKFVELIVKGQQADGTWKAGGQLPSQKRPGPETAMVSTMWNALALGTVPDEAAVQSRQKALDKIHAAKPGESNEWFVARLLIERQFGTADTLAPRIKTVLDRQNADGGWGWKLKDPSDALATGQSLYVLRKAGVAVDNPAIEGGQKFLIETQLKDGSWSVPGTKKSKKGQPAETSTYWGTCWAAIGLLETLPE